MTPYERLIAEHKRDNRIANWLTALVFILVAAAVLIVFFAYHPEGADATKVRAHVASYNHLDVCESTLRGYSSDDDVHIYGVNTGAKSFGGWGSYAHYADGSVSVYGRFNYTNSYKWVLGRCSGGDYASDWFQG